MAYRLEDIVESARMHSRMLDALFAHPDFNKSSLRESPKPLWFVADFIRTTYLSYLLPLLPDKTLNKSKSICNQQLFANVNGRVPELEGAEEEAWLTDTSNWPRNTVRKTKECRELFTDVVSRTFTLSMIITDPRMGPMLTGGGGAFDWSGNPEILRIAEEMKGGS